MAAAGDKVMDIGEQGLTAFHADVPVSINNNQFVLNSMAPIAGFALLDKAYRDPEKSEEELRIEREEKSRLSDKIEPVTRAMLRKEMKIVGWSQNLLKNFSGEVGGRST